jgi:hypothetical protein
MIDFRYHAMSLAAVFVALAFGLLLGVTIGDSNLISNAQGNLEESLKKDVNTAREEARNASDQVERQREFIGSAYPQLVAGRLEGQRVATIGSADVAQLTLRSVGRAVEPAGANVQYVAQLVAEPEYAEIAKELGVEDLLSDDEPTAQEADQLGRAVGRRIARGRDATALRRFVFSRLSGDISRVRLVAYARQVPVPEDTEDASDVKPDAVYDGFERGVVAGISQQVDRVAGVETTGTVPSNIEWYNSLGLSTVDDLQDYSGYFSLVAIFDGAKGDFGSKDSADAVVPEVSR